MGFAASPQGQELALCLTMVGSESREFASRTVSVDSEELSAQVPQLKLHNERDGLPNS